MFWLWAETKTGLCWDRIKQNKKYLTRFKHFGSLTCLNVQIKSPTLCSDLILTCELAEDPKILKVVYVGKIIQHHQNQQQYHILDPLTDHSKLCVCFSNVLLQTKVSNPLQEQQLRCSIIRKLFFQQQKCQKLALKQKVCFCICPTKEVFVTQG